MTRTIIGPTQFEGRGRVEAGAVVRARAPDRLGLAFQIDDGPRGHRSHFFTVTVVPRPTADSMSNSSVSRLTPGSPRPRPPEVEKPLCSARATLGIPGPPSRATTMIPRRLFRSMPFRTIRPRLAYRTMLRASSEIAVAISVRSVGPNPSAAASSRPFWRARTMSASERTGIELSASGSADVRPFGRGARGRPSGCTAPRRSPRTGRFSSARPLRSLVEEGQPFFQVERRVDALQGEPQLHHRERHLRLDADDDRLGRAEAPHLGDVAQGADGEGVHHVERGDVDDHPARAIPADLRDQAVAEALQIGVGQRRLDGRDEVVALLEDRYPHRHLRPEASLALRLRDLDHPVPEQPLR